jgi:hypothetical protein
VSLRSSLVRSALPPRVRGRLLDELEALTAEALGAAPPAPATGSFKARLWRYAGTTAAQTHALEARDDPRERAAAAAALRSDAFDLGAKARRLLHVRGDQAAIEMLCAFYHHIGIEARRVGPAELEVTRCLFANEFDPQTCRLIAALDDGFAAGLAGGGHLVFSARITEDSRRCRAHLECGGIQ